MEKRYILYGFVIIICIIALCVGVYAQIEAPNDDQFMINTSNTVSAQINPEEEKVKDDFNNIFINQLIYATDSFSKKPVRNNLGKDLVYTNNQLSKVEKDKYEMNINIPTVNIVSDLADQINNEIDQIFITKATSILTSNVREYTIYDVNYIAYVNSNILSLVIKSTLKEGNNPQRVIFMTYNYDLDNDKMISFNEILNTKKITPATLQNKINKEIKEKSKQTEDLKEIGYTVYTRNPDDKMYKVENIQTYFMGMDSYIYILFPYGNNSNTSEVDVIVI